MDNINLFMVLMNMYMHIMDLIHLNMFMHIVELVGLGDTSVEAYYRLIALFKYCMV